MISSQNWHFCKKKHHEFAHFRKTGRWIVGTALRIRSPCQQKLLCSYLLLCKWSVLSAVNVSLQKSWLADRPSCEACGVWVFMKSGCLKGFKITYTVALPRDYANEITEFYLSNNKIFFQLNIYCLSLKVVACLWANMLNQAWCPHCWICTFKLSHEPVMSEMNGDLRFDV